MMNLKNTARLGVVALFLSWCFDQLFWQKAPGISFFIFVLLCLGAGFFLTWSESQRPAKTNLLLLVPIVYFAGMTFLRQEPFTLFVNYVLTLGGMLVLSLTWLGGRWWQYSLRDYAHNTLRWIGLAFARPVQDFPPLFGKTGAGDSQENGEGSASTEVSRKSASPMRRVFSILLGILLALPVVSLLAALLASADPIFSDRLNDLLQFLELERLPEYIFRLGYILVGAYLLSGVYLYALLSSREEKTSGSEKPWFTPFLGWLESVTILASVDLLFAFFVAIQFKYFFGGKANVAAEGFTYAEYARRGFGELVVLAFLSLLLFLVLSAVARRERGWPRRFYSGLGIGLVGLVGVILVSAFQRLLLYEAAYGFSRIRTYTHVFMIWLGVLLLSTTLLEGLDRLRHFALAAVLVSFGFGLTLNLLNVDGFIARQNVARADQGKELDRAYLISLSDDAVSILFELFDSKQPSQAIHDDIGAILACRSAMELGGSTDQPWPSFHWSRELANRFYRAYQDQLAVYPVRNVGGAWEVKINGNYEGCWGKIGIYD